MDTCIFSCDCQVITFTIQFIIPAWNETAMVFWAKACIIFYYV